MTKLLLSLPLIFFCSCGVKGKPLPPESPRELGIGRPQYEGVDKEMKKEVDDEDEQMEPK